MKYRVHTYQVVRRAYEVEADSPEAAAILVDRDGWDMTPVQEELQEVEWLEEMIVDPILANGEVDYPNVKHFMEVPEES